MVTLSTSLNVRDVGLKVEVGLFQLLTMHLTFDKCYGIEFYGLSNGLR